MDDTQALILLNMINGPALSTVRKLLDAFPAPADIFRAGRGTLAQVGRMTPGSIGKILEAPHSLDPEAEQNKADKMKVRIMTFLDRDYPAQLREIYDFPPVLYIRGRPQALGAPMLAVVGTRKPSLYGSQTCRALCRQLIRYGLGITSGMARGIDKVAHETALEAEAETVAVLGCGIDVTYPAEHAALAERIAQAGAIVSEFPFGTRPQAYNFPRRNRIISGLSLGVLVAEAAARSGSLITASCGLEQNRQVFAVPGKIDSARSDGTNALIKSGAKLVMNIQDILEELPPSRLKTPVPEQDNEKNTPLDEAVDDNVRKIYDNIQSQPVHLDSIADIMAGDCRNLLTGLLELEMKGLVISLPGRFYVRTQKPIQTNTTTEH